MQKVPGGLNHLAIILPCGVAPGPITVIMVFIKIYEKNTIARPHIVEENILRPCWRLVGESPAVAIKNPPIINISPANGPAIFHIRKSIMLCPSSNRWHVWQGVVFALVPHGTIDVTILKSAKLRRGEKTKTNRTAAIIILIIIFEKLTRVMRKLKFKIEKGKTKIKK